MNKFKVGDIVEWTFSDTASFVGFITSFSLDKKQVAVTWFGNNNSSTYDIYLLQHFKRLS